MHAGSRRFWRIQLAIASVLTWTAKKTGTGVAGTGSDRAVFKRVPLRQMSIRLALMSRHRATPAINTPASTALLRYPAFLPGSNTKAPARPSFPAPVSPTMIARKHYHPTRSVRIRDPRSQHKGEFTGQLPATELPRRSSDRHAAG